MMAKMVNFVFILFYLSKDCTDFVQIETNWIGSFAIILALPNDKNNVHTKKKGIFICFVLFYF